MWDDENDKQMMRNHFLAIILMTALLIVWLKWFVPRTVPMEAPTQQTGQARQSTPAEGPSADIPDTFPDNSSGVASQWPHLPAPAAAEDPSTDEVILENGHLRLVFTRVGARLKRAHVLLGDNGAQSAQLVPIPDTADAASPVYPLGLFFTHEAIRDELDKRRFDVVRADGGNSLIFRLTLPGVAEIRKIFSISDTPFLLDIRVEYENMEDSPRILGMDQTPAYILTWSPGMLPGAPRRGNIPRLVWRQDGINDWLAVAKAPQASRKTPFPKRIFDPEWIASKTLYFMVAFRPVFDDAQAVVAGLRDGFRFGLATPRHETPAQSAWTRDFQVYIGPNHQKYMAAAWSSLPSAHRFFESVDIMDALARFLLRVLNGFYAVIPNYGLGIIFLTVLVRIVMIPLTLQQTRSMKRTQLLAPELEKLKEKYGNDPQEMNKRMMEMYRERGVNPFGGCFPVLLQMPVFIVLYRMLWNAFEFYGAPFAGWITDLSEPDRMLHMPWMQFVPVIGAYFEYLNLLPILGGAAIILSTKLTPQPGAMQNPQQKLLMTLMPVMFMLFCYNLSAGLNLYILVSTVLGVAQTKLIPVGDVSIEPKKKKPARKRQHFYTAAQARKRRIEKEIKESGKRDGRKRTKGATAGDTPSKAKKN